MKKYLALAAVAGGLLTPAVAVAGPASPPQATQGCSKAISQQESNGVTAGGGPKAATGEAPTNCDHYYQDQGYIGSGSHP